MITHQKNSHGCAALLPLISLSKQVLADWGRYDCSAATLRLRLLLNNIGRLQQHAGKLQQAAAAASLAPHLACDVNGAPLQSAYDTAAAGWGQALSSQTWLEVAPEVIASAGKGIPLGTPRMPASERITAVVLQHGKNNHDARSSDEAQTDLV